MDIAVQPCNTLESLPEDEHLKAVGLLSCEQHPTEGKVAAIRSTIRFDDTYPPLRGPSQPKGWETRSVLLDAGYSPEEVATLIGEGAALDSSAK